MSDPTRLKVLPTTGPAGKLEELRRTPAAPETEAAPRLSTPDAADTPELAALRERVIEALQTVYDPELPVNLYDLGLIYAIDLAPPGDVHVRMTLTAPGCPVAGTLPGEVQRKLTGVEGVTSAKVDLVWNPPWTKARMSEAALLELGML